MSTEAVELSARNVAPLEELWPLFGLKLTTPRLELRPVREPDLPTLVALLPHDAEQDPRLPTHVEDVEATRAHRVLQSYWRGQGSWTATEWAISFAVIETGQIIGVQVLEANDFPRLRMVETASWLGADSRGRGFGKVMRAAVLHLAFEGLGAQVAETEAWHDNGASIGVSRALGYEPNGETRHARGDRADRMVRMRLPREEWRCPVPVEVEGLEACRAYFRV